MCEYLDLFNMKSSLPLPDSNPGPRTGKHIPIRTHYYRSTCLSLLLVLVNEVPQSIQLWGPSPNYSNMMLLMIIIVSSDPLTLRREDYRRGTIIMTSSMTSIMTSSSSNLCQKRVWSPSRNGGKWKLLLRRPPPPGARRRVTPAPPTPPALPYKRIRTIRGGAIKSRTR